MIPPTSAQIDYVNINKGKMAATLGAVRRARVKFTTGHGRDSGGGSSAATAAVARRTSYRGPNDWCETSK